MKYTPGDKAQHQFEDACSTGKSLAKRSSLISSPYTYKICLPISYKDHTDQREAFAVPVRTCSVQRQDKTGLEYDVFFRYLFIEQTFDCCGSSKITDSS